MMYQAQKHTQLTNNGTNGLSYFGPNRKARHHRLPNRECPQKECALLLGLEAAADEEKTTLRMSERERDLEKYGQEKINECVENLREMEEIENQLQQSCGHFTTSYTYDIDSWLKRWKRSRETKLECYTCVLGSLGQRLRHMKVGDRIGGVTVLRRCMEYKESKMRLLEDTTPSDVDPSQLQALHEEHLQDDVDLLEQHLSTIRRAHRFLANQLRPKAV